MLGLVCFSNGIDGPCDIHDNCYSICGKSKEECDSEFFFDMLGACRSSPAAVTGPALTGPAFLLPCSNVTTGYYFAVVFGGADAYAEGQKNCCKVPSSPSLPLSPPTPEIPELQDMDQDFMPDDWER